MLVTAPATRSSEPAANAQRYISLLGSRSVSRSMNARMARPLAQTTRNGMTHSEAFRPMINATATVAAVAPMRTGHTGHAVRLRRDRTAPTGCWPGASNCERLRSSVDEGCWRGTTTLRHRPRCQLREICRLPPWSPRGRPFCLLPAFEGAEFQKVLVVASAEALRARAKERNPYAGLTRSPCPSAVTGPKS